MKHKDKTTTLIEILNLLDDSQQILIRSNGHRVIYEGDAEYAANETKENHTAIVDSIWYGKSINTLVIDLF